MCRRIYAKRETLEKSLSIYLCYLSLIVKMGVPVGAGRVGRFVV